MEYPQLLHEKVSFANSYNPICIGPLRGYWDSGIPTFCKMDLEKGDLRKEDLCICKSGYAKHRNIPESIIKYTNKFSGYHGGTNQSTSSSWRPADPRMIGIHLIGFVSSTRSKNNCKLQGLKKTFLNFKTGQLNEVQYGQHLEKEVLNILFDSNRKQFRAILKKVSYMYYEFFRKSVVDNYEKYACLIDMIEKRIEERSTDHANFGFNVRSFGLPILRDSVTDAVVQFELPHWDESNDPVCAACPGLKHEIDTLSGLFVVGIVSICSIFCIFSILSIFCIFNIVSIFSIFSIFSITSIFSVFDIIFVFDILCI